METADVLAELREPRKHDVYGNFFGSILSR
jgi:hypothetical protein